MGQAEAFELDVGPARVVEQPDAVAEQNGRDAHEDLVEHTRVEHCRAMLAPRMLSCGGGGGSNLKLTVMGENILTASRMRTRQRTARSLP